MKVFVKNEGSTWTTYYAVDAENKSVCSIEVRYADATRSLIDTYLVATYSADRGTFDALATEVVMTYEKITEKQWKEVKKELTEYLKYTEVFA